jgi:palmitoyltransferase
MDVIDRLGDYPLGRFLLSAVRYVSKTFSTVLMLCAITLLAGGIYFYFVIVIPIVNPTYSIMFFFNWAIGIWVSFNLMFNYLRAVTVDPGGIPQEYIESKQSELDELMKYNETQFGESWSKYCRLCKAPKPPRCHHCHISGRCILRMDHFCPWINNCVGFRNYRYFYLFLFYLWVGSLYISCAFGLAIFDFITNFITDGMDG